MEEINLDIYLGEPSKKKIKINGEKIEIRPFLTTEEKMLLSKICYSQYIKYLDDKDNKQFASWHLVRLVFDLLVASICTNIKIDGVTIQYKDGFMVDAKMNLDANKVLAFDKSCVAQVVKENVWNYQDSWDEVVRDIDDKEHSAMAGVEAIVKQLPSIKQQKKVLDDATKMIQDFSKQYPDIASDVIKKTAIEKNKKDKGNK